MSRSPVRVAGADDLSGVLALFRHLHPDDPVLEAAAAEAIWRELISQPQNKVFVIDGVGFLKATCTLTIIPSLARGGRGYAVIENVVTHPECRRRGMGSAVLAAAVEASWAANCYKVSLATGSQRPSTLRFYEAAGFVRNARNFFEMRRD
jgi:ribosomal protein S18 acetylase RimI-like enzyme